LGALIALVSGFLFPGVPLLALWVGSRVQTEVGLSMAAVAITLGMLIVTSLPLYKALTHLNAAYDEAVRRTRPRRQLPWQEPLSGKRRAIASQQPLSAIECIVVATVVAAVLAFALWFFFLA
jgi:hypothetical protein